MCDHGQLRESLAASEEKTKQGAEEIEGLLARLRRMDGAPGQLSSSGTASPIQVTIIVDICQYWFVLLNIANICRCWSIYLLI